MATVRQLRSVLWLPFATCNSFLAALCGRSVEEEGGCGLRGYSIWPRPTATVAAPLAPLTTHHRHRHSHMQHMQLQLPLPLRMSLSHYLSLSLSLPLCLSSVDKQLCKFYNFPWRVVFVRADDFLIATAFGISRLLRLPASLTQRFVVTTLPPFPLLFLP